LPERNRDQLRSFGKEHRKNPKEKKSLQKEKKENSFSLGRRAARKRD